MKWTSAGAAFVEISAADQTERRNRVQGVEVEAV